MSLKYTSRLLLRAATIGGTAVLVGVSAFTGNDKHEKPKVLPAISHDPPERKDQIAALESGGTFNKFDLLVIGGGATGAGIALDAVTRGLKVALVEKDDFSSGTSSKSTKLFHGGVRYLEKALLEADPRQLSLVYTALHERSVLLRIAPHLTAQIPTITPCYSWPDVPYYWAGLKAYDLLAGRSVLQISRICTATEALALFPPLAKVAKDGRALKGAVLYFDGQMDDSRYNVALATTAARAGATVLNHIEAVQFNHDKYSGRISGAILKDNLTGKYLEVSAKVVVNSTGPFLDTVRKMASDGTEKVQPVVEPSRGSHIVLPEYFSGPGTPGTGLIVPKTKDGRVLFLLPWKGRTIAGTTDNPGEISENPKATDEEVDFILEGIRDILDFEVSREDVLSVWSGIRPLVKDPQVESTSAVLREHLLSIESNGLISVGGGKWTTYRRMAEEAVDLAIKQGNFQEVFPCVTEHIQLTGGDDYDRSSLVLLTKYFIDVGEGSKGRFQQVEPMVARHLATSYGDRAPEVLKIAGVQGLGRRLSPLFPFLEAEVVYSARNEFCETATDFLARRSRLAFLDAKESLKVLPRVVEILAKEKNWGWGRKHKELREGEKYIRYFLGPEK